MPTIVTKLIRITTDLDDSEIEENVADYVDWGDIEQEIGLSLPDGYGVKIDDHDDQLPKNPSRPE